MLFYVTSLNLAKFLIGEVPKLLDDESNTSTMTIVDALNHNDLVCMNYIWNEFGNTLYDVYILIKSVKHCGKLWTKNIRPKMIK
jgi:hypothetical protein